MTADRNARIEERAYYLWLEEGRPHGRHDEHWHRAERELIEEERDLPEVPPATASRNGTETTGASRSRAKPQVRDHSKAELRGDRSRPVAVGSKSGSSRRSTAAKSPE